MRESGISAPRVTAGVLLLLGLGCCSCGAVIVQSHLANHTKDEVWHHALTIAREMGTVQQENRRAGRIRLQTGTAVVEISVTSEENGTVLLLVKGATRSSETRNFVREVYDKIAWRLGSPTTFELGL
jgi:hypothetical protein